MTSNCYHYKIEIKKKGLILLFALFFFISLLSAQERPAVEYSGGYYSPYRWDREFRFDARSQKLLSLQSIEALWKSEPADDVFYFKEGELLLKQIFKEESFVFMQNFANKLIASFPEPLPVQLLLGKEIDKGKYAGVKRYWLSGDVSKKSVVNLFSDGTIQIDYADGRQYVANKECYFENGADGNTRYVVYFDGNAVIHSKGGTLSLFPDNSYSLELLKEGQLWRLDFVNQQPAQYLLKVPLQPGGTPYLRAWIVPSEEDLGSATLFLTDQLRVDLFFDQPYLLFSDGKEAVLLQPDFSKILSDFDAKRFTPVGIKSYKMAEGVCYEDLNKASIRSEFIPRQSEGLKKVPYGGFDFWLQEKDCSFLYRLDAKKLAAIPKQIESFLGLKIDFSAPIVIPPSLKSYGTRYAKEKNQYIGWYPSGFQVQNYIVLWPFSLPRYQKDADQQWVFNQELYATIAHEYTHLLLAHSLNYLSSFPIWLNEGIAVSVESLFSKEVAESWEKLFKEAFREDRLLDWGDMVEKPSGAYSFKEASTYYAQSFEMVQYLLKKEGKEKLLAYVKSFQRDLLKDSRTPLILWKENFKQVFGYSWEENCAQFDEFALNLF